MTGAINSEIRKFLNLDGEGDEPAVEVEEDEEAEETTPVGAGTSKKASTKKKQAAPTPNLPAPMRTAAPMELKPYEEPEDAIADIERAKKNVDEIIQKTNHAIEHMMSLAVMSDHPRAYEVLANLLNSSVNMNKEYVKMAEQKHKLKEGPVSKKEGKVKNVTNNNLMLSSKDFLKMINGKMKDDIEDAEYEDEEDDED